MPYTPPSHRSPASSTPASPDVSRRSSIQPGGQRPSLPRSASYLTRHRRTPAAAAPNSHGSTGQPSPQMTSEDLKGMAANSSVRQSPPPVTDDSGMPKGAVISPPESSSGSDEDDLPEVRGRQIKNLRELKDAISQIPQHRESSPTKGNKGPALVIPPQAGADGLHQSFSAMSLEEFANDVRKISHTRSSTDPNILVTKSADNSMTASDDESDQEVLKKPQMVRKKSGELVRPALRPPSRRRPSSMPGTPTFSKAVHFDSHLEHVRHFLQVDRPLAVSAGSSPADNYDSDTEFPFNNVSAARTPPYEWEIVVTNFPVDTPSRKAQPVKLERVWLSPDQKCLTGSVVVANLAFQKFVTCRFTLDYWKTTSEVAAEYVAEVQPRETTRGHDRFHFTIKLSDLANLECRTLFFCIRYSVTGQEFWDNNGGTNFQVDFKKKMLPQNGKNNFLGAANRTANGLPRSNRRTNPSLAPRPRSMPVGLDDFGDGSTSEFSPPQSLQEYLGDSAPTLRLKSSLSTSSLPSDNLTTRLASPSGQAFANRYDFGASLTAAVQAARDSMSKPGGLYMKSGRKPTGIPFAPQKMTQNTAREVSTTNAASAAANKALPAVPSEASASDTPAISSASYEEIVSKYCFFGSKQTSPQIQDGTLRGGQLDGTTEGTQTTSSTASSSGGSPVMMQGLRRTHGAQHHALRPVHDSNPYFQHAMANTLGTSSVVSPSSETTERASSPLSAQPRKPASGPSSVRSVSPASMVGHFAPFTGTSPNELPYYIQDRFPFVGNETHTPAAIKG